jgi:hypothetical protein
MAKYCFEISKIETKKATVRVNADSLKEAENILENAYENGLINFDNEEEPEYEYEIQSDSCNEDDTFDDEQFSDEGLQLFE